MRAHAHQMSRRELLAAMAGLGLSALTGTAAAAAPPDDDEQYDFVMPRVKFESEKRWTDYWNIHPAGDLNLCEEFAAVARCKVKLLPGNRKPSGLGKESDFPAVVTLTDLSAMRRYPFLFMTANGHYELSASQRANVRDYVRGGGFLLMDDCVAEMEHTGDFFYRSSLIALQDIFGAGSVVGVPREHEVFRNVHDLRAIGLPYMQGVNHGAKGVFIGERLGVFLSSTDIHCGWFDREMKWFKGDPATGRQSSLQAIQMGINLLMYALSR